MVMVEEMAVEWEVEWAMERMTATEMERVRATLMAPVVTVAAGTEAAAAMMARTTVEAVTAATVAMGATAADRLS